MIKVYVHNNQNVIAIESETLLGEFVIGDEWDDWLPNINYGYWTEIGEL